MNDKIITALLAILIALGGWTLSRTFSLSQDMVLIKEKVSNIEETIEKIKQKPRKKKEAKKEGMISVLYNIIFFNSSINSVFI